MNTQECIVLEAQGLKKSFGGNTVLAGVDLTLREGEVVLLQGANGSGKTTLLNILTGNLEPDAGTITARNGKEVNFSFPRPWWSRILPFTYFSPERLAEERLGRTWQDVRLFATQTLRDNIAMAAPKQPGENPVKALFTPWLISKAEAENVKAADTILKQFGLEGREESSGNRISLGQSKRVAIARAIQAGARVLFLDEPLAGLDLGGIKNVVEMLGKLAREHKITLVIIEHAFNIPVISNIAHTVWTLDKGRLTVGTPERNIADPGSELREWMKSVSLQTGRFIELDLPNGARLTIAGRGIEGKRVMNVENVTVNRDTRQVISEPLGFELYEGEVALLEAPNGWGKSTLLDAFAGIIDLKTGSLKINDKKVNKLPIWERARLGLHLTRSQGTLFTKGTVKENSLLNKLETIPLADKANRKAGSLSGGESRRLSFESAINASGVILLMLDEPFQAVDSQESARIRQTIETFSSRNKTFLITIPKIAKNKREEI